MLSNSVGLKEAIELLGNLINSEDDLTPYYSQLQELIEDIHANLNQISIVWSVEDILIEAIDLGVNLSREDANLILVSLHNNHDCDQGITWAVIDEAIRGHNNG